MADWCRNMIEIKGDKVHLENLKSKIANGQDGSTDLMEYLIGLGDIPDDYHQEGWYDYNVERFGTKWDLTFTDVAFCQNEDSISIDVESAWTPITPFLSILCKKYNVNATIIYYESGSDFGGKAEIDSGGNICDHPCSYNEALYLYHKEYFWESLQSDIEMHIYDNCSEMIESVDFLCKEDKEKIELLWNVRKYNL